MAGDTFSRATAELDVDATKLKQGLADADAAVKRQVTGMEAEAGASASRITAEQQRLINRAATAAGAAVGTFVGGSAVLFTRFDDNMREVFSIMPGITQDAMGKMKEDVLGLSKEFGILTDDLVPALGTAIGSGIPEENVIDFLTVAAKAAKAGATDAQTSVKALSATLNAFQIPVKDANKVADSFFNAIDKGVTTFPELSASMSQVAPQAAAMGLSLEDVLAAVTAMTLQGEPTSGAITKIAGSLTALQRTTPAMEQALKNLGFETGQAAIDALGYQGTLEALRAEADRTGVPIIELTGRIEGAGAVLQLTGANAAKANEILGTFGDTTGKVDDAFKVMEGGVGGTARRMVAQIQAMVIGFGSSIQGVAPLFAAFGPMIGTAIGSGLGGLAGLLSTKIVPAILATQVPSAAAGTTVGGALGAVWSRAFAVGAKLGSAVAGVLTALPGSSAVQGAIVASGGKMGAAMSGAIGIGIVATVAVIADQIKGPLTQLGRDIGDQIRPDVLGDVGAAWEKWRDETPWPLGQKDAPDWAYLGQEVEKGLQTGLVDPMDRSADAAGIAALRVSEEAVGGIVGGIAEGTPQVAAAAADLGTQTVGDIAQGILDARQKPVDALDLLKEMMKDALSPTAEITRLAGGLAGQALADGLRSKDRAVQKQAVYTKQLMLDQVTELAASGGTLSKKAAAEIQEGLKSKDPLIKQNALDTKIAFMNGLREYVTKGGALTKSAAAEVEKGLRSHNPQIRDAARDIRDLASAPLKKLPSSAYGWGQKFSSQYAAGIRSYEQYVVRAAAGLATKVGQQFILRSPAKEGALSTYGGPEGWGRKFGVLYERGVRSSIPRLQDLLPAYQPMDAAEAARSVSSIALTPSLLAADAAGGSALSMGDINVAIYLDRLEAKDTTSIRDMAQMLGEEIRLTIARDRTRFVPGTP